jgi:hypothetical protein
MVLTAEQIKAHSAYNTVEWDLPPTNQGYAEVCQGRMGGPFKMFWELHGQGDVKVVVGSLSY